VPKKMLWKVGVYSCLSERLIRDGRDSAARRVVSDTLTPKKLLCASDCLNKCAEQRMRVLGSTLVLGMEL
jgi:hypothetical protein